MPDIRTLSETVVTSAPTLTNLETATTVLTAASLIVTAVALGVAVVAIIGFLVIRRSAEKTAEKVATKTISSDLAIYLEGAEFSNKLKALVESVTIDHIRTRIEVGGGASGNAAAKPKPMEDP